MRGGMRDRQRAGEDAGAKVRACRRRAGRFASHREAERAICNGVTGPLCDGLESPMRSRMRLVCPLLMPAWDVAWCIARWRHLAKQWLMVPERSQ